MDNILNLLKTGELHNFRLAKMLIRSQNIDLNHTGIKQLILCQAPQKNHLTGSYRESLAELLNATHFSIRPFSYLGIKKEWIHSKIKYLPKEFGLLKELEHILIENKYLRELPKELGALPKLKEIQLEDTNIKTLPESIGNLQQLETLDLKGNTQFESLPESIGNLSQCLEMIDLENTAIKQLPKSIVQLKALRLLDLTNCSIDPEEVRYIQQQLQKCLVRY